MNKNDLSEDLGSSVLLKHLPKSIKIIRKYFDFTQKEIADIINSDKSYISKIENNYKYINLNYLEQLARICKINVSDIISLAESQYELEHKKKPVKRMVFNLLQKMSEK